MSHVVSSSAPITSAHTVKQYAGFGILGADIPATGDNGGSPVLNDSINPTSEYHWRVETPPSAGVLTIYPDLTFEWDGTGVPDGSYPWVYRLFEDGADAGTATVSQTVGSGGISADLAATEAGDTLVSAVTVDVDSSLSSADSADTLSAEATTVSGIVATLFVTESGDELAAQSDVAISSALSSAEAGDAVVSSVAILVTSDASLPEIGDTLTATAANVTPSVLTLSEAAIMAIAEAVWARVLPLSDSPPVSYGSTGLSSYDLDAISHAVWSRSL